MSESNSATVKFQLDVIQSLDTGDSGTPSASAPVITHDAFSVAHSLDGTSTPPCTKVAGFHQALTDGAATIDLTALPGTNGATVDATGLKLQALLIRADSGNANPITISEGASNGYAFAGSGCQVAISASQEVAFYGNDATPDVASGDKTLDLAGTGTQGCDIIMIFG